MQQKGISSHRIDLKKLILKIWQIQKGKTSILQKIDRGIGIKALINMLESENNIVHKIFCFLEHSIFSKVVNNKTASNESINIKGILNISITFSFGINNIV